MVILASQQSSVNHIKDLSATTDAEIRNARPLLVYPVAGCQPLRHTALSNGTGCQCLLATPARAASNVPTGLVTPSCCHHRRGPSSAKASCGCGESDDVARMVHPPCGLLESPSLGPQSSAVSGRGWLGPTPGDDGSSCDTAACCTCQHPWAVAGWSVHGVSPVAGIRFAAFSEFGGPRPTIHAVWLGHIRWGCVPPHMVPCVRRA